MSQILSELTLFLLQHFL